ncbi:MAG: HigA family addiction module antitoxin [Desulfohalobiaceae bacterium]
MENKMPPVHPGEILKQELDELGISARSLASRLGVPTNRITGILNQKRSITPDTALRLARYFGTSPEFWLNLQQAYDLKITRQTKGPEIETVVEPFDTDA